MSDDESFDNVVPFKRPDAVVLPADELAALEEGLEKLEQHLEAVAAGRYQELEGRDGLFRLAWRGRRLRLIKAWQADAGPP